MGIKQMLTSKSRKQLNTELFAKIASIEARQELLINKAAYTLPDTETIERKIFDVHLHLIHAARIKLISERLPRAKNIIDIGGANSFLVDLGYSYEFDSMIVIDLPPDERCNMYKNIEMTQKKTSQGEINILYGNITDLSHFDNNSQDLIWAGQVIEHITREDAQKAYKEIFRVLKPSGFFCLDTPNRLLTEIHTASIGGGYVHPEHKIEYYPIDLSSDVINAGFDIIEKNGVCNMPETYRTKRFHYSDFLYGDAVCNDVESSYIQYYKCSKAIY